MSSIHNLVHGIAKLTHSPPNWSTWRKDAEAILGSKDLFSMVMGVPLHPLMLPNCCHGRSETSMHTLLFTYLSTPMSSTSLCKLLLDPMCGLPWRPNSRRMLHQTVSTFTVASTMLPMTNPNQSLNSSTLFSLSHTNLLP